MVVRYFVEFLSILVSHNYIEIVHFGQQLITEVKLCSQGYPISISLITDGINPDWLFDRFFHYNTPNLLFVIDKSLRGGYFEILICLFPMSPQMFVY